LLTLLTPRCLFCGVGGAGNFTIDGRLFRRSQLSPAATASAADLSPSAIQWSSNDLCASPSRGDLLGEPFKSKSKSVYLLAAESHTHTETYEIQYLLLKEYKVR